MLMHSVSIILHSQKIFAFWIVILVSYKLISPNLGRWLEYAQIH